MRKNKKELNDVEKKILVQYADYDMVGTATAKALYISRSTLEHYFESIFNKTDLNPRCFHDLVKLLRMIGEEI